MKRQEDNIKRQEDIYQEAVRQTSRGRKTDRHDGEH
jgi:hypothetical protein